MLSANEDIVRKVNDAFRTNDMQLFLSYCTDDIRWNIIGSSMITGKDAILQMMTSHTGECPDITIHDMFTYNNRTACTGTFSMTGKDGKEELYSFCDLYTFSDGKIQEMNSYVVKMKQ